MRWALGIAVAIFVVILLCIRIVIVGAQAILRARVIETLSNRFKSSRGKVVRMKSGHGCEIDLDVAIDHAAIEDLLRLGVKTDPPVMTGAVQMKTVFRLPLGADDMAERLRLAGEFHIPDASFTNHKVQKRIDSMSLRGLGETKRLHQSLSRDQSFK